MFQSIPLACMTFLCFCIVSLRYNPKDRMNTLKLLVQDHIHSDASSRATIHFKCALVVHFPGPWIQGSVDFPKEVQEEPSSGQGLSGQKSEDPPSEDIEVGSVRRVCWGNSGKPLSKEWRIRKRGKSGD